MTTSKIINPELAAHNIANNFSCKFIENAADEFTLSPDDPNSKIIEKVKSVADLYAIIYDEAFEYFDNCNRELANDSE